MEQLNVYVVGGALSYIGVLNGLDIKPRDTKVLTEADLVLFTGGADVSPKYYGEKFHPTTYANPKRDELEARVFAMASAMKIPMLGICRGSQFLTVMNGGKLVQNVSSHAMVGKHSVRFNKKNNGVKIAMTSTHHQMMYPYNLPKDEYELVAWAEPSRSSLYERGDGETYTVQNEPEIVYYPKSNSLAIQGHPERQLSDGIVMGVMGYIINKYLFDEIL